MAKQARNAGLPKARDTSREKGDVPSLSEPSDSSGNSPMLRLSRRKKRVEPHKQTLWDSPKSEPQGEKWQSQNFKYEARCMCGWVKWYRNPYQASLGSQWHAEIWCPSLMSAKGVGALECYFCGEHYEDFLLLAEHVQTAHGVWSFKERKMLPQPGGGKTQSQRDSGGRQRPTPSVPFVKVEDLTQDPKRAKVLGVQTQNTGFNDVIVKIAMGGRSYFLGLKASNPNYDVLVHGFGLDENKWIGQEFMLGLNWNEFFEKNFVHVFAAPAPGPEKKK